VKPDVAAMGEGVTVAGFGSLVSTSSGTSFAGPIIAGMAACLWEAFPDRTNMEVYDAIIRSGHQFNNPDSMLGYGIPNFVNALYLLEDNDLPIPAGSAYAFPSVFGDFFTVYFEGGSDFEGSITAYDMLGRTVFDSPFSFRHDSNYAVPFDSRGLPPGLYLLHIAKAERETLQLLKLH
jgi:hypothetical protein